MMIKTYKYRIKDKNRLKLLDQMSREVKFTWNVINAAARKKWKESRKYFHKYDPYYTDIVKGASKEMLVHSHTLRAVLDQFHKDIRQQKKQLRFKGRKTLGWIPFKEGAIKIHEDRFTYAKMNFRIWKSRPFPPGALLKTGCFTQDCAGRWYVNFVIECPDNEEKCCGSGKIGIDLGLKTTATCSDGKELQLKELEEVDEKIKKQQRARNFKRVKKLHIHKANKRKDKICKFAKDLVKTNGLVVVGNVSGFTKGNVAKSRYNNAWSILKKWIEFKCLEYGAAYQEVSEYRSTQRCNECGSIEGPKGLEGLSVRQWECSCGAGLNRDINAAINILNAALGI